LTVCESIHRPEAEICDDTGRCDCPVPCAPNTHCEKGKCVDDCHNVVCPIAYRCDAGACVPGCVKGRCPPNFKCENQVCIADLQTDGPINDAGVGDAGVGDGSVASDSSAARDAGGDVGAQQDASNIDSTAGDDGSTLDAGVDTGAQHDSAPLVLDSAPPSDGAARPDTAIASDGFPDDAVKPKDGGSDASVDAGPVTHRSSGCEIGAKSSSPMVIWLLLLAVEASRRASPTQVGSTTLAPKDQ
jgi:hypothetical protein